MIDYFSVPRAAKQKDRQTRIDPVDIRLAGGWGSGMGMRNCWCLWYIVLMMLLAGMQIAAATEGADEPLLRIEIGDHTGIALGLSVSRDGSKIATAGYDQTVRIWSMPGLDLVRVIHIPAAPGVEGAVFSGDFSPDGETFITSGWTGGWKGDDGPWCFYIINVAAGEIDRKICDLPKATNHIAFSPNGEFLAMVLKAGAGLRVYSSIDYRLIAADVDYRDSGIFVDFDARGQLATSSLEWQDSTL